MENKVLKRVITDSLIISELEENNRGCKKIARLKTGDSPMFFLMENDSGMQTYKSKRDFTELTITKYVARGIYSKGMAKGITKAEIEELY